MLHKEMLTAERAEVLKSFASAETNVLVCTDIAQRGLDLPNCQRLPLNETTQ